MERLRKQDAKDMVAYFENRKKEAETGYTSSPRTESWFAEDPETIQKVINKIKSWGKL